MDKIYAQARMQYLELKRVRKFKIENLKLKNLSYLKLLSLLFYLLTTLANLPTTVAFTDISPEDPNRPIYQHLHDTQVMTAREGAFFPSGLVTRAEALTIAMRAGGIWVPPNFDPNRLPADVPADEWFAPVVARAIELGFVGDHSSRFRPYDAVVKAEYLAFLFRAGNTNWKREQLSTGFLSHDINHEEDWFTPLFRYAHKFGIARRSKEKYYHPYRQLTRSEVGIMTYRQLKLFHGDELTRPFMQLQASIDQFVELVQDGQNDEAMFHLQKINQLAHKISIRKNDKNAVAARFLAKSMKSLINSLQAMEFGNNLRAIEQIFLATDYSQKAAKKSPEMEMVTVEIDRIIENTLMSLAVDD